MPVDTYINKGVQNGTISFNSYIGPTTGSNFHEFRLIHVNCPFSNVFKVGNECLDHASCDQDGKGYQFSSLSFLCVSRERLCVTASAHLLNETMSPCQNALDASSGGNLNLIFTFRVLQIFCKFLNAREYIVINFAEPKLVCKGLNPIRSEREANNGVTNGPGVYDYCTTNVKAGCRSRNALWKESFVISKQTTNTRRPRCWFQLSSVS